MSYELHDKPIKCQWGGCILQAISRVYNDSCTQSIYVCSQHRFVCLTNLEATGGVKLRRTMSNHSPPGTKRPENRPQQQSQDPEDWAHKAAKKQFEAIEGQASEAKTIGSVIIQPRKV